MYLNLMLFYVFEKMLIFIDIQLIYKIIDVFIQTSSCFQINVFMRIFLAFACQYVKDMKN